jgi:prevent-host-death family protein
MISATEGKSPRARGYGLPCVKCHTYYFADLDCCPVCKNRDRIGLPSVEKGVDSAEALAAVPPKPVLPQSKAEGALIETAKVTPPRDAVSDCWSIILGAPKQAPPAQSMSAGQLRARFVHVLEEVSARQNTVVITKRGKPVAKIVPAEGLD